MAHESIQPEVINVMNRLGNVIDEAFNGKPLPKNRRWGFVLLCFEFGPDDGTHRMNYISNAERENMLTALKELIANFEGRMIDKGGTA
jgi:hypothetical protein